MTDQGVNLCTFSHNKTQSYEKIQSLVISFISKKVDCTFTLGVVPSNY